MWTFLQPSGRKIRNLDEDGERGRAQPSASVVLTRFILLIFPTVKSNMTLRTPRSQTSSTTLDQSGVTAMRNGPSLSPPRAAKLREKSMCAHPAGKRTRRRPCWNSTERGNTCSAANSATGKQLFWTSSGIVVFSTPANFLFFSLELNDKNHLGNGRVHN